MMIIPLTTAIAMPGASNFLGPQQETDEAAHDMGEYWEQLLEPL